MLKTMATTKIVVVALEYIIHWSRLKVIALDNNNRIHDTISIVSDERFELSVLIRQILPFTLNCSDKQNTWKSLNI